MLEAAPPTLQSLKEPVERRIEAVYERIVEVLTEDFGAVDEVNEYLLAMRGKFLRPTLLLLCNEAAGRRTDEAETLAAVVELVHVATLVHDDSVDHSVRRRGMPTVNSRWTHQVAVIMGDYLYSRAVTEIAGVGDVTAIELLARAANRMTVGEMRQLTAYDALSFSEEDYYLLCECKTASLMAAACELGAYFGAPEYREQLREYGFHLGMAYQIVDDLLDYTSSARDTGKPSGLDLRQHKVTLPLIAAQPELSREERDLVRRLFDQPEPAAGLVESVIEAVERTGAFEYAHGRAEEYASNARRRLVGLPETPAAEALGRALDFAVERRG